MHEYQRGQILLIVVLVMATALTVGLSVVSRSITDKKTSQESANSGKAFSAAEAGIERSLTTNNTKTYTGKFTNNTHYTANITTISGLQFPLNNAQPVLKDDTITLWLSTYPTYANPLKTATITFYWGQPSDKCITSEAKNSMAALELTAISGSALAPHLTRYAYDPCGARRSGSSGNNLSSVGGGGSIPGVSYKYQYSATIPVTNGLFVDVTPLYAQTVIGVKCNSKGCNLPSQGTIIQSLGTADNTQRKLITYRFYPQLPSEMFQYSLFAPQ